MTLVFGKSGQVATELSKFEGVKCLGRDEADLLNSDACVEAIRRENPIAVINAAAYTAVDKAEEEETLARQINGDAPDAMARACADLGIPFVHISTDYVFEGGGTSPWKNTDPVLPQNAYGRTKLAGENAVLAVGANAAILRTSWVFSAHGANFLKTMLRLSETRDALTVVADQIGGPTPAADIAKACLRMANVMNRSPEAAGVYHFSGAPDVSWADFARHIFDIAGRNTIVSDIPTVEYPTPATRPLNSRLDCTETERVFGIKRPDWRAAVETIVVELER